MIRELPKPYVFVPALSRAQQQLVGKLMRDEYQVEPIQMFELAGRHLAHLARLLFLKGKVDGKGVLVLAGTGSKGYIALNAARKLHQWGANIRIALSAPIEDFHDQTAHMLRMVQRQGIIFVEALPKTSTLIIDGMAGSPVNGAAEGTGAELCEWANRNLSPVLSINIPTGLEADTGIVHPSCMRASATLALGLPKIGLLKDSSKPITGELYLADIGIPPALYALPGIEMKVGHIFAESDIVRLR